MISRLFATYWDFDASWFPLKFATDRFASLWSHIDLRVSAHDFGENFLWNLLKSKNLKICFLLQKPRKKPRYGPIAQLGERTVRIRKVVGSIPIRSTILRKITAKFGGDFSFDHRNTTDSFLFWPLGRHPSQCALLFCLLWSKFWPIKTDR